MSSTKLNWWLRRRLSQRKRALLPQRNRKLQWERKHQLATWRKPSKCWIHSGQCAKVYFNTTNRKHSQENRLRLKRLEKVLSWGGWKKRKKNWKTTTLLFFVVQLEFAYHADNWTVHSKLSFLAVIAAQTKSGYSQILRVAEKKNVIHQPRSVRIGKNCTLCLAGGTQDRRHSFSQYEPPAWWITYISPWC